MPTSVEKQQLFLDRKFRPQLIEEAKTATFIKGHAITHGHYIHNGKTKGRVIIRYFTNPENPMVPHLHFYTENLETVERIKRELMRPSWMPWHRDNPKRCESTYSFGVEFPNGRGQEPVFMSNVISKLDKWNGKPSPITGPYWTRVPGQVDVSKNTKPTEPAVWIQGRLEHPGDVSQVQIDGTTEDLLTFYEKQFATQSVREWADKVRAGEHTFSTPPAAFYNNQ